MNYILDRFSYIQCSLTLHTYTNAVLSMATGRRSQCCYANGYVL